MEVGTVNGDLNVSLIANAGLLMEYCGTKIMIDGIYGSQGHPFSNLSGNQWSRMLRGKAPYDGVDYLMFTHDHPDHFSREMTLRYLRERRVKGIFLPSEGIVGSVLEHYLEENGISCVELSKFTNNAHYGIEPAVSVQALRTRHLDRKFRNVANYCYLITFGQKNVLITADVDYVSENFLRLQDVPLRGVFINPLFFNEMRGGHFFRGTLEAEEYIIYHLPYEGDDRMGMRRMTERNLEQWNRDPRKGKATALSEPGQRIVL